MKYIVIVKSTETNECDGLTSCEAARTTTCRLNLEITKMCNQRWAAAWRSKDFAQAINNE